MKNLFDYATKELSQDAFLRWLFESYEDDEIKPYADFLLRKFCKLADIDIITDVKTAAQWCKIDIEVKFNVNGVKHVLYIEDKTYSEAHNQLDGYNIKIQKYQQEYVVTKIFYKTHLVTEKDRKETDRTGWKVYDINDIVALFEQIPSTSNVILNQYIEHITKIRNAIHNTQKPIEHNSREDLLQWETYFNAIGGEIINEHGYIAGGVWKAGQFPYICLVLKKDKYTPYLEIRSKDCLNNRFEAVILCYGLTDEGSPFVPDQVRELQKPLLGKINNDRIFSTKGIRNSPKEYNKQLGRYISEKEIVTDKDFVDEIEKCALYYDELMAFWKI